MMPCLQNSPSIYSYTRYVIQYVFLIELLTILDSFFTSTTNDYIEVVG